MTENARLAQIIAASGYVTVAMMFAAEDHGMQVRPKLLSWLRLIADFLETKPRSESTDEKLDAEILRALIEMIEGLPTGGGDGSRVDRAAVVRQLFKVAA